MNRPLVVIVPGLFSEGIPPQTRIKAAGDGGDVPSWCVALALKCLAALPTAVVYVCNYIRSDLPAWIVNAKEAHGCDGVLFAGHSDGAACGVWAQDKTVRALLPLRFNAMVFLDVVTDLVRHGLLARIHPAAVDKAILIEQTADWIIHANPLYWDDGKDVQTIAVKDIPGANAGDNHGAMVGDAAVQDYVVNWMRSLASA